jgi:acetyl-CoA acetyltransferase
LVQRRHSSAYGTLPEQLGILAVEQRRNAQKNENALLREPLSLDGYLTARLIADPLRLFDCVLPCAGGDAVVITTKERAKDLRNTPVQILAGGSRHNHNHRDVVPIVQGWQAFAGDMFSRASCSPNQMDFLQLYDDYPIMEAIQLEALGFCKPGESGPFLEETDISLTGTLPINTGGGQLSAGQAGASGGYIGLTEAVRQLQGEGGPRQVTNCRRGLVSGFGMVAYGRGLSCSSVILGIEGSE